MANSLPPHPHLENLRKQAKSLLKAFRAGDTDAVVRIRAHLLSLKNASDEELRSASISLSDAQRVIALEHGFRSWPQLKSHVEGQRQSELDRLLQYIVDGDEGDARRLVEQSPDLVRHRDSRHGQTPLHVAAHHGRLDTARLLLESGADLSDTDSDTGGTPLHVAVAWNQLEIAKLLLDQGGCPRARPFRYRAPGSSPLSP